MQASSPMPASTAATPARGRRTVDAPTRMFHWLFALSFAGAYLTADADRWRQVHVSLGYTMAGLLVFRLLYGLFGPAPVRLPLMWRKLDTARHWLAGLWHGQASAVAHWRQGPGVALGAVAVLLLLVTVPVALTGYATYDEWGGEWLEEVHEWFGNLFLVLVLAHLTLVAGVSLLRGRNLAMPMITGRAPGQGPDLVKASRGWLAAIVVLAVLAFWGWQWQAAPAVTAPSGHGTSWSHDDDDD